MAMKTQTTAAWRADRARLVTGTQELIITVIFLSLKFSGRRDGWLGQGHLLPIGKTCV